MRILLVTAYFRPHVGGVERFVEVLAAGLGRRGHQVTVLCCRTDSSSAESEDGGHYAVRRIPAVNPFERRLGVPWPLPAPRALRSELRSLVATHDVVHVQDVLYATSLAALRASRHAGRPSLVTQHVAFVGQANAFLDGVQRLANRAVGPTARGASRIVTLNPAVAIWAEQTWRVGAVDVLPVGVSVAPGTPSRQDLGLPVGRFVALFVGRDVPKKGFHLVAEATDPMYEIVAVTDTVRPPAEGLEIRPFMPPDDFAGLLRAVDALVLPSVDEGLPLVLQEAAVAGVPIVTTRQPGFDRYFGPGDVVYIERNVESVRSALRRLASDAELRRELAARSYSVGERYFSADAFVEAYEQTYMSLRTAME